MGSSLISLIRKCVCCVNDEDERISTPRKTPPTLEDVISHFKAVNSTSLIDELINEIKQLSPTQRKSMPEEASTSSDIRPNIVKGSIFASFSRSGAAIHKFANERIENSQENGRMIAKEILQVLGNTHWIVAGLAVIAYLLGKLDEVSDNREECLQLLESMVDLASHIKNLKYEIPEEKDRLEKAVECIVEGSLMCASQLYSISLFRFLKSSVNSESLYNLRRKVKELYDDLTLTATIAIKQQQPGFLPLSQPPKSVDAVGIEHSVNEVMKLLDMTSTQELPRAVVIYGYGGIGKTTLATAVVATSDIKTTYNYTRVEMDELPTKNDVRRMQQQILKDAFPNYNNGKPIKLRHCNEGRDHLTKAFECAGNKPVFIFIDNSLRDKDLRELMPEKLHNLPHHSRILLTTRNLKVTDMLEEGGLKCLEYLVQTLPKEEAIKILLKEPVNVDLHSMQHDLQRILKICDGIPLILKIVSARLRKHNYRVEQCTELVDALERGQKIKQYDLSDRLVDFVYEKLEESTQDAFLDICCYFNNWNRRYVEYIVGTEQVKSLEDPALVSSKSKTPWTSSSKIKLVVHDVIRAKGRSRSEDTRIMTIDSFREAKEDEARLKRIRGLWLMQDGTKSIDDVTSSDDEDDATDAGDDEDHATECLLEERDLNLMKKTLRVVGLGKRVSVEGRSLKSFEDLRYLQLDGGISCLPVSLEAQNRLAVYHGPLFKDDVNLSKLPKDLLMLKAKRQCLWDPKPVQAVKNSSLKELNLSELGNPPRMGVQLHHLIALKLDVSTLEILILDYWGGMKQFPEQVCELRSLTKLSMKQWDCVEFLPELFGQLSSLTDLSLNCWEKLKELPYSLGKLRSLQNLDLFGYIELKELPSSFGQLNSLQTLDLTFCSELKKLPPNELSSLKTLELRFCNELKELPSNFGQLNSLQTLDLGYCNELKEFPSSFCELSCLQALDLIFCSELKELPSNFGQLTSLQTLDLGSCSELKGLPSSFGQLSSLQTLDLGFCSNLEELPFSFGQLGSLKRLNLSVCLKLENLPSTSMHLIPLKLFHFDEDEW